MASARPADGAMAADFHGESPGEMEMASAGELLWTVKAEAAVENGWCEVLLASGRQFCAMTRTTRVEE